MFIDARIPVVFGELADARAEDALLIDGDETAPEGRIVVRITQNATPAHATGCVCCVPRSAAGSALAGLFLARGRGDIAYFRRVFAVTPNPAAIIAAIDDDNLASGWFRIG
jgi:hypothetical protein